MAFISTRAKIALHKPQLSNCVMQRHPDKRRFKYYFNLSQLIGDLNNVDVSGP